MLPEETLKVTWEEIPSEDECFNDELVKLIGKIHAYIRFGDLKTGLKDLLISDRNIAILGRDNFDDLGQSYAQKPWPQSLGKQVKVNSVTNPTFSSDQISIAQR